MAERIHPATDETLERLAIALEYQAFGNSAPTYDSSTGRYTNLGEWLNAQRNGKIYGVRIPKFSYSTATACTKTGANASLSVTPSTAIAANSDDYTSEFPFMGWDVNGGADTDGTPFATSIRSYDTRFNLYGGNGNVWRMAPVLYWHLVEETNDWLLEISDTQLPGFEPQPGAKLPDGTLRPFMLYAKYAGGNYGSAYSSVSGVPLLIRSVSHNSLISLCSNSSTGYSGKSIADHWYLNVMFTIKYATKNSQSVFAGCTGYTYQYKPTVAETGVTRVILSSANAANLVVGSSMMMGNQASASTDRNSTYCYNVFDGLTIKSIETYDSSNSAVYFDTDETFDTDTTYLLSTRPYNSGFLDSVQGVDGTVSSSGKTNGKEPFLLQGIECMLGAYEILGDVMLYSGTDAVDVYVNYDSASEASAYSESVYTSTGAMPIASSGSWLYCGDIADAGGFLVPATTGASTSTGLCDGFYQSGSSSNGWREFQGLGNLNNGANAGLWCGNSNNGLSNANWNIASRTSGLDALRGDYSSHYLHSRSRHARVNRPK